MTVAELRRLWRRPTSEVPAVLWAGQRVRLAFTLEVLRRGGSVARMIGR